MADKISPQQSNLSQNSALFRPIFDCHSRGYIHLGQESSSLSLHSKIKLRFQLCLLFHSIAAVKIRALLSIGPHCLVVYYLETVRGEARVQISGHACFSKLQWTSTSWFLYFSLTINIYSHSQKSSHFIIAIFVQIPRPSSNGELSSQFLLLICSTRSRSGGRGSDMRNERGRSVRGRGGGNSKDKIDALGRLLTRILRHMASELSLDVQSDGYVRVGDLLKLNLRTFANIPLTSHSVDDIREAVRKDNKQRFGLLEENGELLIRANQGHTVATIESESLLKPILSPEEAPVCVHGTYRKNLDSILQSGLKRMKRLHVHFSSGLPTDGAVISGMRRDVNVLIFLNVRKALQDGMKLYISENKVVLTEGFDGVVPVKYFDRMETWPSRQTIPLNLVDGDSSSRT